jgi:hypothetical protein
MDEFTKYYSNQAGKGLPGQAGAEPQIGEVYRAGFVRGQAGRGIIGNFLKGLWGFVSPLFTSGAQSVGRELAKTGANIVSDVVTKGSSATPGDMKSIASQRLLEGRDRLVSKMSGSGRRKRRSRSVRRVKGKKRTRRAQSVVDIFSRKKGIKRRK